MVALIAGESTLTDALDGNGARMVSSDGITNRLLQHDLSNAGLRVQGEIPFLSVKATAENTSLSPEERHEGMRAACKDEFSVCSIGMNTKPEPVAPAGPNAPGLDISAQIYTPGGR